MLSTATHANPESIRSLATNVLGEISNLPSICPAASFLGPVQEAITLIAEVEGDRAESVRTELTRLVTAAQASGKNLGGPDKAMLAQADVVNAMLDLLSLANTL